MLDKILLTLALEDFVFDLTLCFRKIMVYLKENINLGGKVHYPINNFHCPQLKQNPYLGVAVKSEEVLGYN